MFKQYTWAVLLGGISFTLIYLVLHKYFLKAFILNQLNPRGKGEKNEKNPVFYLLFIDPIKRKLFQYTPRSIKDHLETALVFAGVKYQVADIILFKAFISLGFSLLILVDMQNIHGYLLKTTIVIIAATIGFFIPDLYLRKKAQTRKEQINRTLPIFADYLMISVEAGMGIDNSIYRVIKKLHGPLAEEIAYFLTEINFGKTRKEAFKLLASRVNLDDFSSFINALVSGEQMGVSMGNILKIQGQQLREKKKQKIQETAYKIPVKLIFPLVLFIFPGLLIVLLGPAAITAFNTILK